MPRLVRPNPPLPVRLTVALRQLGEMKPFAIPAYVEHVRRARRLRIRLAQELESLARKLGCEVSDLRLDHTWALENRPKVFKKGVHVDYEPKANDPDWLGYRPHGTQFAGSHDVKTRIRGDHGQLSDNALAMKNKRMDENRGRRLRAPKRKIAQRVDTRTKKSGRPIQGRSFQQMRCAIGARCFCVKSPTRERKRCGNYRPTNWGIKST